MKAMKRRVRLLAIAGGVLLMTAAAEAQGLAVRGGANVNPDQVYVGGSYEFGPVADKVWLQPSGDIGFGNGARLLAANADLMYRLWQPRKGGWRFDVGGGPAVNHYRFGSYSQTEAGLNAVGALVHASGWSTDMRVGFLDSPDFRVGVSYRLHQRRPTTRRK